MDFEIVRLRSKPTDVREMAIASTHDCRNWKRDDRRRKRDDDEEAEMRRSKRKFMKRIAPMLNLLMPELIKGSSEHEIMKESGEN
jgi:hypothetical protein